MIGGYMKRTSLLAIAASASLFATGASAADLGGNCCADLEERIAELEATTVRKGNRKVSLTVSGHVNEDIVFWDDGHERNIYAGMTNLGAQTRFRFVGNAKITGEVTAGYLLEIGTASTRSIRLTRTLTTPAALSPSVTVLGGSSTRTWVRCGSVRPRRRPTVSPKSTSPIRRIWVCRTWAATSVATSSVKAMAC